LHYDAAPLQGITTYAFRALHARIFGGADRYYMPFLSPTPEHHITNREMRDLMPENNAGVPVVPQIMTHRAEDFLWAAGQLFSMGYEEINLNLGCPSGTVVSKGKGAGFLAHPDELDRFFDTVFSASPPVLISVKTRLGIREPKEFARLLEIYNRYPMTELIIHPRVQKDFYKLPARREAFAAALPLCRMPVSYNGDLVTTADCRTLTGEFPTVRGLMLGRGLIGDPALARKLHGGAPASREELAELTEGLYQEYCVSYGGPDHASERMKELWFYLIHLFDDDGKYAKKLRRAPSPAEFKRLESFVLQSLPLRTDSDGGWS
jgi:tRNA-dihydrouridine synthase